MAEGGHEYTTVPEERFKEEDHKSIRSCSSKASSSSSSTQTAIKARAKAEAGRSKFAYVQREIELKVEKACLKLEKVRLDATLEALQTEKEMDAALIEAEILESGLIDSDHQSHRSRASNSLSPQTQLQRTEHYVQDQSSLKSNSQNPHASSYQELTLATSDTKQPVASILYTPVPMKTEASGRRPSKTASSF